MDRQVLGVLKTTLQHNLGWNEIDYSNLVFAFQTAYAFGMVFVGRFIDRVGTRIGYAVSIVFWSVAAMAHAACTSLLSFTFARAALGLGESAAFPASMKTVTEWFPQKERALATGIFNAGSNVGAILTPLIVPWIVIHFGWRAAFLISGAAGLLWFALWITGKASTLFGPGARLHSKRRRSARCEGWLGCPYQIPADVGLFDCQISHGSRLVVLSFLAARISTEGTWLESGATRLAPGHNLRDLRCGQRSGRLALVAADQGWILRECREKGGDARVRCVRGSDHIRLPRRRTMAVRSADRFGGSCAPGVLCELVHDAF
jgi:MFS family permease